MPCITHTISLSIFFYFLFWPDSFVRLFLPYFFLNARDKRLGAAVTNYYDKLIEVVKMCLFCAVKRCKSGRFLGKRRAKTV